MIKYTIRPLQWETDSTLLRHCKHAIIARTPMFDYSIVSIHGELYWSIAFIGGPHLAVSIDAAKKACQHHLENYLDSVLETFTE